MFMKVVAQFSDFARTATTDYLHYGLSTEYFSLNQQN